MSSFSLYSLLPSIHTPNSTRPLISFGSNANPNRFCLLRKSLPEKVNQKFRFNTEFIEMRYQALDVFVNRIASHHELQQTEDLRTFLQAD